MLLWLLCLLRFNSTGKFRFASTLALRLRNVTPTTCDKTPWHIKLCTTPSFIFQLVAHWRFCWFKSERRWNSPLSAASRYMNAEKHYSLGQLLSASGPTRSRAGACPWSDWCRGPSDWGGMWSGTGGHGTATHKQIHTVTQKSTNTSRTHSSD